MTTTTTPSGAVVVAVDGSEHAARALEWGAVVASREHRPLVLAHAMQQVRPLWPAVAVLDIDAVDEAIRAEGERLLQDAAAGLAERHPTLEVHTVCESGDARDLLVGLSHRASLLVVGSRGRGHVRSLLLGSVAAAVSRHAVCPVVVLRPHSEESHGQGVLVGTDGTEQSRTAVEFAFRAASWLETPLTVLHCFWDLTRGTEDSLVPEDDSAYEEERALVSASIAGLREKYPDVRVQVQLARGLVDRMMVDLARGRELLVVGARSHGALTEAVRGSVATTLVEYATCPVAVVPHEQT